MLSPSSYSFVVFCCEGRIPSDSTSAENMAWDVHSFPVTSSAVVRPEARQGAQSLITAHSRTAPTITLRSPLSLSLFPRPPRPPPTHRFTLTHISHCHTLSLPSFLFPHLYTHTHTTYTHAPSSLLHTHRCPAQHLVLTTSRMPHCTQVHSQSSVHSCYVR